MISKCFAANTLTCSAAKGLRQLLQVQVFAQISVVEVWKIKRQRLQRGAVVTSQNGGKDV